MARDLTDAPARCNTDCDGEGKIDAGIVYRIIFYAAAECACLSVVILGLQNSTGTMFKVTIWLSLVGLVSCLQTFEQL